MSKNLSSGHGGQAGQKKSIQKGIEHLFTLLGTFYLEFQVHALWEHRPYNKIESREKHINRPFQHYVISAKTTGSLRNRRSQGMEWESHLVP